ncbi:MAG: DUF2842 domain-containing protein [Pseudomonadota bacterium]
MEPSTKKLILALACVPFLVLYAGLALAIWDWLPENRLVDLVFFILAGTAWAFPLKPVMGWANSPKSH